MVSERAGHANAAITLKVHPCNAGGAEGRSRPLRRCPAIGVDALRRTLLERDQAAGCQLGAKAANRGIEAGIKLLISL
jgi:hypothetical protein